MVFSISDSWGDYSGGRLQFSEVVASSACEFALLVEVFLRLFVLELIKVVLVTKLHLLFFLLLVQVGARHRSCAGLPARGAGRDILHGAPGVPMADVAKGIFTAQHDPAHTRVVRVGERCGALPSVRRSSN